MPTSPSTRRRAESCYIADEATARAIGQVLTNLDRPKPQVLIKVVFLEVTRDDASDIGIEGYYSKNLGNSWNSGTGDQLLGGQQRHCPEQHHPRPQQLRSSAAPTCSDSLPRPLSAARTASIKSSVQDFMVTIHAIAQAGKAKVLSRPSILARNNQPATITVGQSVPLITGVRYDNFGNAINSITYQDVGVILKVTPFITGDDLVRDDRLARDFPARSQPWHPHFRRPPMAPRSVPRSSTSARPTRSPSRPTARPSSSAA